MTEHKIHRDWDTLRAQCERWRAEGRRIAFTNGVFDLLHGGHLDSLRRARAQGDVLVVALNTDESVRRLKGEGRPVLPLEQRMRLLAALECVDAVASFSADTPLEIIHVVAPDALCKGGHYAVHEIVGHEFVLARGGRVLSLPLLPGRSTTGLVETIKRRMLAPEPGNPS